jgi:hypothetical protein
VRYHELGPRKVSFATCSQKAYSGVYKPVTKSTALELIGAALIIGGLYLIQPLSLVVAAGISLVAIGYKRGN